MEHKRAPAHTPFSRTGAGRGALRLLLGDLPAASDWRLPAVDLIRAGIPSPRVRKLLEYSSMTDEEAARGLHIARRTLQRRFARREAFGPEESEKFARLAAAFSLAEEVFEDREAARRWLRKPNRALVGRAPLSLLDTEAGTGLVLDVLRRIEHGLYS